jgi:phosphatidylglycerophosphate synthase
MELQVDPLARRPLKTRASAWAGFVASILVKSGISPNMISVLSIVFASAAGVVFYAISNGFLSHWYFLMAALFIQMRLLCNLMDGMVAIEGGKKSATGDLYNEVPDRIADVVILAGAGLCVWLQPWGMHLGWCAAALAVMTACVRMQGAALLGKHNFCGPMAKPHRMALTTGLCFLSAFLPEFFDWFLWGLALMLAGELITLVRRISWISKNLKGKS